MDKKRILYLIRKNSLFYLSRKLDYPLIAPDSLQVNFTFKCNLRCTMCSMFERMQSFKLQNRPYQVEIPVIKKLIKEAYRMGVRHLILIGGEPFLEPRLFELILLADQCGFKGITVVTNGTLINEEIIKNIVENNLHTFFLSISIDAASEDTFAKIRGERVLGKIIANVNLINRIKNKQGKNYPKIVCVTTIMDQNLEELQSVVSLCQKLSIPRIIFQPVVVDNTDQNKVDFNSSVFVPSHRYKILDNSIDGLIKYKLSNQENFKFIANSIQQLRLIKKYFKRQLRPRDIRCYAGFNRIQVVQEEKIYFCVNQDRYEPVFGDVKKDNLRSLWFSKKAKFSRKCIRKCTFPCLQWCSYRDEFIELFEILQKGLIFHKSINSVLYKIKSLILRIISNNEKSNLKI